jgi:hypothetical protein
MKQWKFTEEATKSSKKQRNKPYVLEMTAKELDKV